MIRGFPSTSLCAGCRVSHENADMRFMGMHMYCAKCVAEILIEREQAEREMEAGGRFTCCVCGESYYKFAIGAASDSGDICEWCCHQPGVILCDWQREGF